MGIKKIELEVWFADDFVPPEKFGKCRGDCPFFAYEADECSEGFCCIVGTDGKCPIKKYFSDIIKKEGM